MGEISTVGLDIAKSVFQVHGIDAGGTVVVRRQLRRVEVEKFFAELAPCLVAMEACGSAHYWARTIVALGHEVRLLPPAHVKPYVKRGRLRRGATHLAGAMRTEKPSARKMDSDPVFPDPTPFPRTPFPWRGIRGDAIAAQFPAAIEKPERE